MINSIQNYQDYNTQFQTTKPSTNMIDRFSKYKGNFKYYALEIYFSRNYSKASDVFAFSIVCYEIFNRSKLFNSNKNFFDYIQSIVINEERPSEDYQFDNIPIYYKELIQKCWSDDLEERPTFNHIIQFLKSDTSLIDNEEY